MRRWCMICRPGQSAWKFGRLPGTAWKFGAAWRDGVGIIAANRQTEGGTGTAAARRRASYPRLVPSAANCLAAFMPLADVTGSERRGLPAFTR